MSDTTMLDLSVNEIVRRWPAAVAALNERGIDTCCGGALSLRDAAGAAGDLETQDLAIDRIQWHQKTTWMLKSYLK